MEFFFRDRTHVRLRNRERGTYLHADEDGWGVSLSPHRASLNTAWAVHLVPHTGATYVLLHSAAYGRYLGVRREVEYAPPPQGHPVGFFRRLVQCLYNAPLQADVLWEALSTEDVSGDVFLGLAPNQNPNHWMNSPWTVEDIPPQTYAATTSGSNSGNCSKMHEILNGAVTPVTLRRMIRYIRADDSGIFISPSWRTVRFIGRSLLDLIAGLANLLNDNFNNITLCVMAGFHGRITPLVINLPLSVETMDIVVLTTGSAAAMELKHPNIDAM